MLLIIWSAVGFLALPLSADKSSPPQRLVKLMVAASSASGDPVSDLQVADVQVSEDGTPRSLVFFRYAGSARPIFSARPDEFVNQSGPAPMLVLLDAWNARLITVASAWQDVRAALGRTGSVDRVYIYILTTHGDLFPVYPLVTADRDLPAGAPPTLPELVARLDDSIRKIQGVRGNDVLDPVLRANKTFQALGTLSQMASTAGRKNLIWVTYGFPLTARLVTESMVDFTEELQKFTEVISRFQVAIYPVNQSEKGAGIDLTGLAIPTLKMFAELTGGRWYPSGRAYDAIMRSISDARGSYRLAYDSPVHENVGKEHKIRLHSARKGVRLLTRDSYFDDEALPDPDQAAQAAFADQIHCPFDAAEIALRVSMSRKPAGTTTHFEIRVEPADILLERSGDRFRSNLSIAFAFYSNGVFQSGLGPFGNELDFDLAHFSALAKDGIVLLRDVPMDHQIQQVRVMVFDPKLQGMGSVTLPMR